MTTRTGILMALAAMAGCSAPPPELPRPIDALVYDGCAPEGVADPCGGADGRNWGAVCACLTQDECDRQVGVCTRVTCIRDSDCTIGPGRLAGSCVSTVDGTACLLSCDRDGDTLSCPNGTRCGNVDGALFCLPWYQ